MERFGWWCDEIYSALYQQCKTDDKLFDKWSNGAYDIPSQNIVGLV